MSGAPARSFISMLLFWCGTLLGDKTRRLVFCQAVKIMIFFFKLLGGPLRVRLAASQYISNQGDVETGCVVEPPPTSRRGADPGPARPADPVRNGAIKGSAPGTRLYVVSRQPEPMCEVGSLIGCGRTLYKAVLCEPLAWTPSSHKRVCKLFLHQFHVSSFLLRWVCSRSQAIAECL